MEEFAELRLRKDVVDALRNIGVTQPTVIQVSQMDCRLQCIKRVEEGEIMQPCFLEIQVTMGVHLLTCNHLIVPLQILAIPKILRGKNVLCAAETGHRSLYTSWCCRIHLPSLNPAAGSGKTLAYLVPLLSQLREEEEQHGLVPRLKRPRTLILLPSRDLAAQVLVSREYKWSRKCT